MSKQSNRQSGRRIQAGAVLAVAVAAALGALPAQAIDFTNGEWSGTVDTTVSYGVSWRAEDYDPADVGKAANNPTAFLLPRDQQFATVGRWSNNDDDGDLNYREAGDIINNVIKLTAEADIRWRNYGGFFRASGFYDFDNHDAKFLSDVAQERVGSDVRMLDAYIWGNHELDDRMLNWRFGQQVVSWGESTFIQGGINVINPVDVSKLRLAGSEIKEAFEGVNMVYSSLELTDSLSLEALYLLEWEPIIPDPTGSYYGTSDIAAPGASYAMLGFGLYPQPVINPDLYKPVCLEGNLGMSDTGLPLNLVGAGCNLAVPRLDTRNAKDSGQFGMALRWFAEDWNSTEFGFYYLRYHSRLPVISGKALTAVPPPFTSAGYWTEYPEDIDLFGLSFNSSIGTWSVGGEISYRPNLPLQADDVELLFAALTPLNPLLPAPVRRYKSQLGQFAPGAEIQGWHEHQSWQGQSTLTKLYGPDNWLRADQVAFVAELGLNYVPDLHSFEELRYNGPATDTGGGADFTSGDFNNPVTEPAEGFADDFSWGYRLAIRADYFNVIGAVGISPRLVWSQDVDGTTPGPGGAFVEDTEVLGLGAAFNYLDRWIFDLAYNGYMGGDKYNLLRNRDFYSVSVRYSF